MVRESRTERARDDERRTKRSRSKDRRDRSRSKERRERSRSPKEKRKRSRSPKVKRDRSRSPRPRKERSRSPRARKDRSRSPKTRRDRSRSRTPSKKSKRSKRSRSRSRDRKDRKERQKRSKSKERKKEDGEATNAMAKFFDNVTLDKEEAEKQIEAEMQKRRERIEQWRAEKKKKELEQAKSDIKAQTVVAGAQKSWTFEEDSDEENIVEPVVQEDEVDPLDAFMNGIQDQVRKISKVNKTSNAATNDIKRPVIVTGVAHTKGSNAGKNKGELMEQNMDGLEYSSEEEKEDLHDTLRNMSKKTKKDPPKVDHAVTEYPEIRKDFYVEVPEIAAMTEEEVSSYRESLEGIKVKGLNCPRPIKCWPQCGVSKKTLDCLKKFKYDTPTPIQAQAIPAVLAGRDVIAIAKTGSGKTLAFLLPLLRHVKDQLPMWDERSAEKGSWAATNQGFNGPIGVIMTPTRELALQIGRECRKFCRSNVRVSVVYGGTSISEQIAELKRGTEIIVCTPGRMIDMLAANNGKVTNLQRLSYIVLDEADRMFDMGFEPQVNKILENVRPTRQIVLFSATFPRQVENLARKILQKPIEIAVGGKSIVCSDVTQEVSILETEDQKFLKLLELLGNVYEKGQTIVFVEKQEAADMLYKDLLTHSYHSISLHGGIDQVDRDTSISHFRGGRIPILVATSVAARGLDVPAVILVVNYDAPNHYEDYVHRCGRTGRAGNKGKAFTFLTVDEPKMAGIVIRAMESSLCKVPQELHDMWNEYKEKCASEGKKVKMGGGGFSGKGFKFDAEEANMVTEKKKFHKAALGMQDSDDEDIEEDLEEHIMKVLNTKRIVKEVSKHTPLFPNTTVTTAPNAATDPGAAIKLELAKKLAMKFNAQHAAGQESGAGLSTQKMAEIVIRGPTANNMTQPNLCAKTIAEQMAQKLNNRLNYTPQLGDDEDENPVAGAAPDENSDTYQKFEEELEINGFPQVARWRVTSKEALAQISEYSEAGITVRGTYCSKGKEPPEEERKLFLAIESTSELAVSKAKNEIIRLLREELIKLRTTTGGFKSQGRYKVL